MKSAKLNLVIFSAMAVFSFSSCNDNDKRGENDQMLNDSIQMAEENRLEQERMDFENNSVFAMVQEDTVLTVFTTNLESNEMNQTFLEEEGPYTVFAPTNMAYENLSQEERDALTDPQNMQENSAKLYYLVVDEELTEENLRQEIETAGGTFILTSMQGEEINATLEGDDIILTDPEGNTATIIETDLAASNGVIHIIDEVIVPSDVTMNEAGNMNNNQNRNNSSAGDTTTTGGM